MQALDTLLVRLARMSGLLVGIVGWSAHDRRKSMHACEGRDWCVDILDGQVTLRRREVRERLTASWCASLRMMTSSAGVVGRPFGGLRNVRARPTSAVRSSTMQKL